jgi:hypothetical protein
MAETERTCYFLPLVDPDVNAEDEPMFSVHCPAHGCEVLLSERRILRLTDLDEGIRLDWICWCGERGSLITGRPRPPMSGRLRPAV